MSTEINPLEFIKFLELIKLKKEKPEDYKELIEGFESVSNDIIDVAFKLAKSVSKKIDELEDE